MVVRVKIRRLAPSREVPLQDKLGLFFNYNLADPLPEYLHNVDSLAHGASNSRRP